MTLDKAIQLLSEPSRPGSPDLNPDHFDAIKLGIQAIERISACRRSFLCTTFQSLPGETVETDSPYPFTPWRDVLHAGSTRRHEGQHSHP